jgi:dTDP-glucose 4,6-dehydratase
LSITPNDREIGTLLVTGGCGFIGSNFIRHILEQLDQVRVINLDSLTYAGRRRNLVDIENSHAGQRYFFIEGDICDESLVNSLVDGTHFPKDSVGLDLTPNVIVNFAAETHVDRSIDDSSPFIRTNVLGTQTLLEAARQVWTGKAEVSENGSFLFLQISTDEVYGSLGDEGRFIEGSPIAPNSPYSASKAGADLLASAYYTTYGLPVTITRSSNNYGPYQFTEKFIPSMITKAIANQPLPVYGDGQNVRDWLHVEDNCAAIEHVVRKGKEGQVYNIGGDTERRNLEVAEMILQKLNKPSSLISFVDDRLGHDWRYAVDSTLVNGLGWMPSHSFEDGLDQTIEWYQSHE